MEKVKKILIFFFFFVETFRLILIQIEFKLNHSIVTLHNNKYWTLIDREISVHKIFYVLIL